MKQQLVRLALILFLVSVSCGLPVSAHNGGLPGAVPGAVSQLMTPDPNAPATATPFLPVGPTSTTESAAVTPEPTIDIPDPSSPVRVNLPLPEGQVELLVLGSDWRPSSGYRTDVIMLFSINPKKGTVTVVSFPRDLYVSIPGWTSQRINTAQAHGGFEMMADTLEYNFGVRPQYYIMTNLQGFVGIVDSLGGINVEVGSALKDSCDLPQAVYGDCAVSPGTHYMDGATALWYVRSRHSSSDLDRMRRAQEVMLAMFKKFMSANAISRLPELYSKYSTSVETNMGVGDMIPLLPVASQILGDSSKMRRYSIAQGEVTPYVTETGAQVLLPNYEAITQVIIEAVFNP